MNRYPEIYKALKGICGLKVLKNEPLSRHTTMKIGGPADILVIPTDPASLTEVLSVTQGVNKYVIGNGSNILVRDRGITGVVIKISGCLNSFACDGRTITVGAGTLVQPLIRKLASLGLSGLEFASWVPASVGGAVVMNMGAFGDDIGSLVEYVEVLNREGKIEKWGGKTCLLPIGRATLRTGSLCRPA